MSSRSGSSKNDGSTPSCCPVKLSAKNVIRYVQALALDMGTMGIPGQELLQGEKLIPEYPVKDGTTMAWVADESEPPIWTKRPRPLTKADEPWVNTQDALHATVMTHYTGKCGILISYLSRSIEQEIITRMMNCTEAWNLALSTQDPLLFHQLSLKVCTVVNSVQVNMLGRAWEDRIRQPGEDINEFWQGWTRDYDAVVGAGRVVEHHEKVSRMMSALGSVNKYPTLFSDCSEASAADPGPHKPWPEWDVLQQRVFQHHDLKDAQEARTGGAKKAQDRHPRDQPHAKYTGAYSADIRGDEDTKREALDFKFGSQHRGGGGGRGRNRERGGRGNRDHRATRGGRNDSRNIPRGSDRGPSRTYKSGDMGSGRDTEHTGRLGTSDHQTARSTHSNQNKRCENCDSHTHCTRDCNREKNTCWGCLKLGHLKKHCRLHVQRFRERQTIPSNMASVYKEPDNGTDGIHDGSESETGFVTYRATLQEGNGDVDSESDTDDEGDGIVISAFHTLQLGDDSEDEHSAPQRHAEDSAPTTSAPETSLQWTRLQWGGVGPAEGMDAKFDRDCINFDRLLRENASDTESDEGDYGVTSFFAIAVDLGNSSSDSSIATPAPTQSATAINTVNDCGSLFGTSESDSIESTSDEDGHGTETVPIPTSHPTASDMPDPTTTLSTLWQEIEVQQAILARLRSQLRRETLGERPECAPHVGDRAVLHTVYNSDGETIQTTSSTEDEAQLEETLDDSGEALPTILRAAHHAHVEALARAHRNDPEHLHDHKATPSPQRSKRKSPKERRALDDAAYYRSVKESEDSSRDPKFPRDFRREAKGKMCTSSDDYTSDDNAPAYHPTTTLLTDSLTHSSPLLYPGTGITSTLSDYEQWLSEHTEADDAAERDWDDLYAEGPEREMASREWHDYVAGAPARLLEGQDVLSDQAADLQGVESSYSIAVDMLSDSEGEEDTATVQGVDQMVVIHALTGNVEGDESQDEMSDSSVFTVDSRGGGHYYVDLRVTTDPPANLLEEQRANHLEYRAIYGHTHHRTRLQSQIRGILHARIRARIDAIIPGTEGTSPPPVAPEPTSRKSPRREADTVSTHSDSHAERLLEQRLSDITDITRAVRAQVNSLLRDVRSIRRVRARREPADIEESNSSTSYSSSTTSNDHQLSHADGKGPAPTGEERGDTAHRPSKRTGERLSPSKATAARKRQQSGMMAKMLQHLEEVEDCEMEQAQPKYSAHVRGGFRRKTPVLNSGSSTLTPSDPDHGPHVPSPRDPTDHKDDVTQAQGHMEGSEPVPTPTHGMGEESDSDNDDHVTSLMSNVTDSSKRGRRQARDELEVCLDSGSRLHVETRVRDSVAAYAITNPNPNLILRGIEGINMPISHTGHIPDIGSFIVCDGAKACLLSVKELNRQGHQVHFTAEGVIINGREGGSINCHTRANGLVYVLRADLHVLRTSGLTMEAPPTQDADNESYTTHTHTI
ncbi:hypothetical protein B484DRAFT_465659 [Ochromonadaceae sp. CCMP2298]|nr:hypothetical protein B484DRAFT_465659 [Ochromonadaceae sp. CCMP2298]